MGRPEAPPPAPAAKVPEEALSSNAGPAQAPSIAVSSDGGISANVQNRPLGEVLHLMAEKHLFEIQGPLPRTALAALVTMQFSGLTLQQAFNRMMRGYNYAVITEDVSDKRVLMVLSEAKRTEYRDLARPPQTPGRAEETPQQSGAAAAQAAGEAPEGTTTVPPRRATILQQRGRLNVERLPAPSGPVQGAETPQAPAQEQKGQEQQGLAGPGAESGAVATPPKTEGGSAVQDWRPLDRSTLGSF